jgi:hypothetical protein
VLPRVVLVVSLSSLGVGATVVVAPARSEGPRLGVR